MQILDVTSLVFPEVKVIAYGRFHDERGFFTETYRKSDFQNEPRLDFLGGGEFVQTNVSFSKKGVIRGLHFQWDPHMGKLVRLQDGEMVDLFLDIRIGSPTFGKIAAYEMVTKDGDEFNEWIWIPVGFAHGGAFTKDSLIEYFCTAEYSPSTEAGISPLSDDIDWSLCNIDLKVKIDSVLLNNPLISQKDKEGFSLESWKKNPNSQKFIYSS